MSKAQVALIDLFIAFFLFMLLLSVTISTWNLYLIRLNENNENNEMIIKAFQTTDALVKSRGVPTLWNLTNVNLTGLAQSDRVLSTEKVDLFINLTESQIKDIFKIQLYSFSFSLKDIDENILIERGNVTSERVVNVKRYVLYENEPAILEFKIGK